MWECGYVRGMWECGYVRGMCGECVCGCVHCTCPDTRYDKYRYGDLTFLLATYLASPSAILSKVWWAYQTTIQQLYR